MAPEQNATDWALSVQSRTFLNAALMVLRQEAQQLREAFRKEYPDPWNIYEGVACDVDAWLEDVEKLVSDIETLDNRARIKR